MKEKKINASKERAPLFGLFLLGFGSIIGVGWSSTLNNLIRCGGGAVPAAAGFALATVAFIPIALCFARLAEKFPVSGGVTVYAKRAFGDRLAFVGGWFMVMSYTAILPFEAIAINDILSYIFPPLRSGRVLYYIMGEAIYLRTALVGLAVGLAVALVHFSGARSGMALQRLSTLVLLGGSSICILFCLFKADWLGLVSPVYAPVEGKAHTGLLSGIVSMMAIAPQYFAGFDTISQSAELGKGRSIGKTIVGALISAGIFYVLVFLSAGLAYPWQSILQMGRPVLANVLLALYQGALGRALWYICILATLGGLLGAWNGFFIASTRMICGMAREEFLPSVFKKRNAKRDVPVAACALCTVIMLAGAFLGAGVLDIICTLASTGFVISWAISCLSLFKLQIERREKIISMVAIVLCLAMIVNCVAPGMPGYMGDAGIAALVIWSVLGVMFYGITRRKHNR